MSWNAVTSPRLATLSVESLHVGNCTAGGSNHTPADSAWISIVAQYASCMLVSNHTIRHAPPSCRLGTVRVCLPPETRSLRLVAARTTCSVLRLGMIGLRRYSSAPLLARPTSRQKTCESLSLSLPLSPSLYISYTRHSLHSLGVRP